MVRCIQLISLVALASCAVEDDDGSEHYDLLQPRQQLLRVTADLQSARPSEGALRQFEGAEDPKALERIVDDYLQTDAFLDRMEEVFDERFLMRTGDTYFDASEVGLDLDDRVQADMIASEPLELLRHIIANDLPYSEIVTAKHTMANENLATFWGIDREEGNGWTKGTYKDGRPHAGMLTMSTTWQRYPSMGGNANRHRANAISKMFLCDDYLARPIVLNRAAVDELTIDPENAIATNASCQSCHSTLDPLSANLFGFFNYDDADGIEQTRYRPEMEEEWRYYAAKEPGFYGTPTANLEEMGKALSEDARFVDCAVETVWEGLTQREMEAEDWPEVQQHRQAFVESDLNVRELVRSVVLSEPYLAQTADDPKTNERLMTVKTASPRQLAGIIESITGYSWWFDGRDGLVHDHEGLGVLVGGIDGRFVTTRTYTPSVGAAFVHERLAQVAGYQVALHDLDPERSDAAKLLVYVTIEDTPENQPDAFNQQIRYLYLASTGIPMDEDAPEIQALVDLWKMQYAVEASPITAWGGVVSAVLRDPRVLFY